MKDNFSQQAHLYARFRPVYPTALYNFIYSHLKDTCAAWDCGTGNGQVATELAKKIHKVVASDISQKQLNNAEKLLNVQYLLANEQLPQFPEKSFDLITVAQAIHWFDFAKFYSEVNRLGKSKSILAVWGYGLLQIEPEVDRLLRDFYERIVGPYWDQERKLIEEGYASIPFPFEEIHSPGFFIEAEWTPDILIGYLNTWSSVQKYITANGRNPIDPILDQLKSLLATNTFTVRFPVFLRLGKID